jgi:gamma type small acid-soluble spore protein
MENNQHSAYTAAGTNIEEVKKLNAQSGMSYNEVKELLAKTTGGRGTAIYSDTDIEEVKRQNHMREN